MEKENTSDDVIVDETVSEETTSDVTAETEQETTEPSASAETTEVNNEVDEKGVSFKNRFYEINRKYEDLSRSIPQMVQEGIQQAIKSQPSPQQQTYSIEDYQRAMVRDPENKDFYLMKINELQFGNLQKNVESKIESFKKEQQAESLRKDAEAWAVTNFPQLRDPNNAFSREVWNVFNSRPADKREPYDFALACELVAGRLGIKPSSPTQEKVVKQNRTIKKLIKERSLEGGGKPATNVSVATEKQKDLQKALESGSMQSYFQKYYVKEVAS